ncbi:MAG TPA: hypothetical protein VFI42_10560 [Thermomicrobiaceae bacterium]|nr:hypothetical protein [Thermomicrobiaceae bacterium]
MAGWWRAGVGCLMVAAAIILLFEAPISHRGTRSAGTPPAGLATPTATPAATSTPTPLLTVRYFIHGSPTSFHAKIGYVTPNGTEQVPDYQGAWDKVLTMRAGQPVQLTAEETAPGSSNQSITCEIQIDGTTWRHQTAEGPNASVTCRGELGGS